MTDEKFEAFFRNWDEEKIEVWKENGYYLAQYPSALLPEKLRGFYTVKIPEKDHDAETARRVLSVKLRAILKSRAEYLSRSEK